MRKKLKSYETNIRDIIDHLGGFTSVAYDLGVTESAVRRWVERGIPIKYWAMIMEEIDVDANYLYSLTKELE